MRRAPWSLIRTNPAAEPDQWSAQDDWTRAIEQLVRAERIRHRDAQPLADLLHDVVPHADAADRRALLAARRALHSGKPLADGQGLVLALTAVRDAGGAAGTDPNTALSLAEAVLLAETEAESACADLAAALGARREAERAGLRQILSTPEVRHATAFSAAGLARTVHSYVQEGEHPSKRARKRESRLLRFAERAVGRTSPFSTYTVVGRSEWEEEGSRPATGADAPAAARVHRVEVNRVLMLRLLDRAARHPSIRPHWPHRAARVVRRDGETVVVEQHIDAPENQPRVFATRTSRTTLRRSAVVDTVLEALEHDTMSPADLADRLAGGDPRGAALVEQLLEAGILVPSFPVEDHAADPIADTRRVMAAAVQNADPAASGLLAEVDAALAELATAVTELQSAPDSGGTTAADLVERCGSAIDGAFRVLGGDRPAAGFAVYEDVVLAEPNVEYRADWEPVLADLERLVAVLPAFDNLAVTRAAIRSRYLDTHGAGSRRPLRDLVELLPEVFEAASGSLSDAVAALATSDPAAAAALEPRRALADAVRRAGLAGEEVFELDGDWVERTAAVVPEPDLTSRAYAAFVQRTADGGAVVNEVYGGRGQFASRFLGMWGEDALREVRDWVATVTPRCGRELRPVQGFNANVHPPMLDRQLHANTSPAPAGTPGIDDLFVLDDPDTGTLQIQDAAGEQVHPVYLGLLVPFLLPFEVAVYYVLGDAPLIQFDPAGEADDDLVGADRSCVRSYPRVTLGSLVLSRRAWAVPLAEIPLPAAGSDPVRAAADLVRWRVRHGIPQDCFVMAMAEPAEPEPGQSLDPGERWRTQLAAMTAKPLRVRWDSPSHLAQLRSWFGDAPSVWITETLPVPGSAPGEPHCTEHVLELATDAADTQHQHRHLQEATR